MKSWFSGDYQHQEEKYLNESFGFRNTCIRIHNQLAYSLFQKAKANSVLVGKKHFLFEGNYLDAYYGNDFAGTDSMRHRLQRVKFLQDSLAKMNKTVVLVVAADRGSFYPEYFPDRYRQTKKTTNYEVFVQLAKEMGITYIDFNRYFLQQKGKSPYPLFPQYGTHWSEYSACLVADSIIRFVENARHIDMPHLFWEKVELRQPQGSDYDIADGMNILCQLKSFDMAYPVVQFESDSSKSKPSILVIADSFYWSVYNSGISNGFSVSHFWYYNQQVYPESYQSSVMVNQLDLEEQIAQHDVILILGANGSLPYLGWDFIENACRIYNH